MKIYQKISSAIGLLILIIIIAVPVGAQANSVVSAEIDRNPVGLGEQLILSVKTDLNSQTSEPILPPLVGLQVVGQSTSTSISIINGVRSASKIYNYYLQPTEIGVHIIGPVKVSSNGQILQTDPIEVNVVQGSGTPTSQSSSSLFPFAGLSSLMGLLSSFGFDTSGGNIDEEFEYRELQDVPAEFAGQNYFVDAAVDKSTPYVGEQVTYKFRLFRSTGLGGTLYYEEPDFSGFWVHQETEENSYYTNIGGMNYLVTEIKRILMPAVIGEAVIEPAELTQEGWILNSDVTLRSKEIPVEVQPLPGSAPDDFNGAVGRFDFQAVVDTTETKENETVTLKLTISGEGNFDTMSDPEWYAGDEWRTFDSEGTTTVQLQNGKLVGERHIEQILVPTQSGELTIPAIAFSYFDPATGKYNQIGSQPIHITVHPDENSSLSAVTTHTPGSSGDLDTALAMGEPVIKPIKSTAGVTFEETSLTKQTGYWLLWALPFLIIIGQYGLKIRQKNLIKNANSRRSQLAAGKAKKALKKVENRHNSVDYYNQIGRILIEYISEKIYQSVSGWTKDRLTNTLLIKGVDKVIVEQVLTCLDISEMGQYAPTGYSDNRSELAAEVSNLIDKLDKSL